MKPIWTFALALLLPLSATAAQAVDLVVVEARNIDLKQGSPIDGSKPLTLKEGQQVTLISDDGTILTLRGPYDRAPSGADTGVGVGDALEALTTRNSVRNVAGVVRDAKIVLPSPWVVDVSHAGTACVRPGERPVLWRDAKMGGGGKITVMPADRSWLASTDWPRGSETMEAPSNFPVRDGRTYLVDFGDKPVAVTLSEVSPAAANPKMQAAWMIEKGCVAQAEALLRTVR
ncbi:MAG TPA: hypothetical protein VEC75_13750 [Stellaceae bacterium]|nr:hypothetical protein [Stellaceae bacterium]